MPIMSECNSMLLSLTNKLTFTFTQPQTKKSVKTSDYGWTKFVVFDNDGKEELEICNENDGSKRVYAYYNREGYKITVDNQGTN